MKAIATMMLIAMLMMGAVSATNGVLSEDEITMGYDDTRIVEFCLYQASEPVTDFPVVVDYTWQELDNVLGYSAGDILNPTGLTATPLAATTDANGCVDIELNTYQENGMFGYTVQGWNGTVGVGTESGIVKVPEFGVLAALGVLAVAGVFIARRRN